MKRWALALVLLAALVGNRGRRDESRPKTGDDALVPSPQAAAQQAPRHAHPLGAQVTVSAPVAVAVAGELALRERLQAEARLLDSARQLLEAHDRVRLERLLIEGDAAAMLAPGDAEALAVALDCMDDAEEGRAGAERFLARSHGSRLRKQVRSLCFAAPPRAR